jgi:hypothetical protein
MTSFSSGLNSTLVLSRTVDPIALAVSGITAFSRGSSNTLWSTDDFVHCVVMVLTGGVDGVKGAVGWRAKALEWKEIWGGKVNDRRRL